jgi:hypothetical protein
MGGYKPGNGIRLVVGDGEEVAETTTAGISSAIGLTGWVIGNNFTATDRSSGGNLGGTNGSDIRATEIIVSI